MTLDEWIDKSRNVQLLRENLRANLDVMTDLSEEDKDDLMRLNMIMVRQFAQQSGLR